MTRVPEVTATNIFSLIFEWQVALGILLFHSWVTLFQMGLLQQFAKVSSTNLVQNPATLYSHACFHMQVISIVLDNGVGIFCTTVLCDKRLDSDGFSIFSELILFVIQPMVCDMLGSRAWGCSGC
jgi:hypothetical protein